MNAVLRKIYKMCPRCGCAKFHVPSSRCSACGYAKQSPKRQPKAEEESTP